MKKNYKVFVGLVLLVAGLMLLWVFLSRLNILVLEPKGPVAARERELFIITTLLMLIVVVPVFVLTFYIAWKYRAGNKTAKYRPDFDHHRGAEITWWAIPSFIIIILAVITWQSSHELDPFKPIQNGNRPVKVQVVAMQWKWLFIYPEYNVASVNLLHIPKDTPINFEVTADAPMNSFWIPQLGSQVYAMAGMRTKLHLLASETGDYYGSSANISGDGFASMRFTTRATTHDQFEKWIANIKSTEPALTDVGYDRLSEAGNVAKPLYYSNVDSGLYDKVIMKYMAPANNSDTGHASNTRRQMEGHY